jgi:acyl-CoA synthetase (AMP-forming)/AMP-acid ligase II
VNSHATIGDSIRNLPWLIGDIISWPSRLYPEKSAIISVARSLTFAELSQQVAVAESVLAKMGVRCRMRCGILVEEPVCFIVYSLALLRLGALVSPLRQKLPAQRYRDMLKLGRLSCVVADKPLGEAIFNPTGSVCINDFADFGVSVFWTDPVNREAPLKRTCERLIDLDPALLMWTSGTTGRERAICFPHHSVLANMWGNVRALSIDDNDITLQLLPLSHSYGLIAQCLCHLMVGGTIVFPEQPVTLPNILKTIRAHSVTTVFTVPRLLDALCKSIKPQFVTSTSLRLVTVGSTAASEPLLRLARGIFPHSQIAVTYGLTEAGPRVSTRFLQQEGAACTGSVGVPLDNVEVTIDTNDGSHGEIIVRGRSVSPWLAEELPGIVTHVLRTGDFGRIEEHNLFVESRRSRVIDRGGKKVILQIIEDVLHRHPNISEATVVAAPHPVWGEVPIATIRAKSRLDVSKDSMLEYCRKNLSIDELPFDIVFTERPGDSSQTNSGSKEEFLTSGVAKADFE